jgi:hypothetical protein
VGAGGRGGRRVEYGRTYVVRPKGRHQATIVWLHGIGDNGGRYIDVKPCMHAACCLVVICAARSLLLFTCPLVIVTIIVSLEALTVSLE